MKKPKLGDYIFWEGKLARIVWTTSEPTVGIELSEPNYCPHCAGSLGKHQFSMIPTSPLFQENAEPIQTLEDK